MSNVVSKGDLIAVYGLLRKGASAFERFNLAQAFAPAGPCVLPGTLYDLGGHPGMTSGAGSTVGELFRILDPSVVDALDDFEDFYPEDMARSRYHRQMLRLRHPAACTAWVYVWIEPSDGKLQIPHGDWLRRVGERPA